MHASGRTIRRDPVRTVDLRASPAMILGSSPCGGIGRRA
jgi:hypothetical protein